MTVGFTGTRQGMNAAQRQQLRYVLALFRHADIAINQDTGFVDGDCPAGGADQEARTIASELGLYATTEPPVGRTAKALLERNRRIVERCSVLIVAPRTDQEELRSGTWATVRYARKRGISVVMLSRGE